MNRVILMGRLTRDPEVRYSQGERSMAIARYTLAVDRRGRRGQEGSDQTADFINCVAFDSCNRIERLIWLNNGKTLDTIVIKHKLYAKKDLQQFSG